MPVLAKKETLPVAQARAGESAAWDALFRRFQLPLYSYVHELLRNEQTSLDIVQETFIKAVRHISSLRDDDRFGAWLFRIAHQRCQDYWRRSRPMESIDDESFDCDSIQNVSSADPLKELLSAEEEEQYIKAIDSLPDEHRSVVLLHCIENFQLSEIADITGVPLGTVKSRLHNARKKLRQQLAPEFKS